MYDNVTLRTAAVSAACVVGIASKDERMGEKMLFSKRCRCNKNYCNKLLICTEQGSQFRPCIFGLIDARTHTRVCTSRGQWMSRAVHGGDPTKKGSREGHRASVCAAHRPGDDIIIVTEYTVYTTRSIRRGEHILL